MLRFASFNCHSVRSNIEVVRNLLESHDIVLLQELMIHECDIGFIEQIDKDFACNVGVCDKTDNGIISGRPSRGVAVMYRKYLLSNIQHIDIDDRINGILITHGDQITLVLNVYLPYDAQNAESLDEYNHYLGKLRDIIENSDINNLIIAGDMNAGTGKEGSGLI